MSLSNKITEKVVRDAVNMLKPGKVDISGSFSSDVFLNAPQLLFQYLAYIFRSFVFHGTVTREILCCAFLPLFKGGLKNPAKFESYRAIAGASQILKIFEYVILILWGDKMCTDSMQFGFKKETSTTQCSWLVLEVAQWFYQRGGMVHAAFLDLKMAFDKCLFSNLFIKLREKGIPSIIVRVLCFAYQEQKAWVRLGCRNSSTFDISNGTRQGSVLSPYFLGYIWINC